MFFNFKNDLWNRGKIAQFGAVPSQLWRTLGWCTLILYPHPCPLSSWPHRPSYKCLMSSTKDKVVKNPQTTKNVWSNDFDFFKPNRCDECAHNRLIWRGMTHKHLVTLSLKPSCWPADNQRSAGSLVKRSVKHSVVKSVPVMSSSWRLVFSHSTNWTWSLRKPVEYSKLINFHEYNLSIYLIVGLISILVCGSV